MGAKTGGSSFQSDPDHNSSAVPATRVSAQTMCDSIGKVDVGDLGASNKTNNGQPKYHTFKTNAGRGQVRECLNANTDFGHDLPTTSTKLMNEIRKGKK
ncbi:uncharacterized protein LOC144446063 isoform X2 [Glandiceps talaboti]